MKLVKISLMMIVLSMAAYAENKEGAKTQVSKRAPASLELENKTEAVADTSAKWHVAQILDHQDINVKKFGGGISLVSVYNGGINAPIETFLTIFDPTPQDGGDFGTFKTFSLGNFAGVIKLIDSRLYDIKADEQVVSLAFTVSNWNPNTDTTSTKVLRFRANVHAGEVSTKATMSLKDK